MNLSMRVLILVVAVALVMSMPFSARPAAGHEHEVVGPYEFTIGWIVEPPVVGVMNALDLSIIWVSNGTPVDGAHAGLSANLTKGAVKYAPPLRPVFRENGSYTFDVMPTEPGTYSVEVFGMLGTTPVDFSVEIQDVVPASDVQFPRRDPTPGDLQAQLTVLLAVASVGLVLAAASTAAVVMMGRRLRKAP